MATALSNFVAPVRVLIGDSDPDIQFRDDAQIIAALQTAVNLGKVVSGDTVYALDTLGTNITPDLTPASDTLAFCLLVYHAAKLFAVDITPTQWRTRAFSETVGENKERVFNLFYEIYTVENGGMGGSSTRN